MITVNVFKKSLAAVSLVVLGVIASSGAHAQILLQINISDPTAVTITATGSVAGANVSGASSLNGIELLGFFSGNAGTTFFTPVSSLAATGGPVFDDTAVDLDPIANSQIGLDIFRDDSSGSLTFSTGQTAFSGTLTLNLNGKPLPAAFTSGNPTSGDIMVGYSGAPGATIGQWQIVTAPEPSTWMLLLASLAFLPWLRSFRRS